MYGPKKIAEYASYIFITLTLLFVFAVAWYLLLIVYDGGSMNSEKMLSAIGGTIGFAALAAISGWAGYDEHS